MSMKVTHISTSDLAGGAARAAYRLHHALLKSGVDSQMLVRSKRSLDDRVATVGYPRGLAAKLAARRIDRRVRRTWARYEARRPDGYDPFTDDRCGASDQLLRALPACDIVNLHWVRGIFDFRRFFGGLPDDVNVVWTLHDMNAFTGGCHYDHGCGRFMTGCGACPQLGSDRQVDWAHQVFARKQEAFKLIDPQRLHIVTPSRWLADVARQSPLLGRFAVHAIPNGIDTDAFAPRDRCVARQTLGLPNDAKVLAFVAHGLEGKRKGFDLLRKALTQMRDIPALHLLSAGGMHALTEVDVTHTNVGQVADERLLSLVYSAADVFVVPSLQDNLPNTVIESMACGTPVVGFDVGGIPEMVEPGKTGWLCPPGDTDALAGTLTCALNDPHRSMMGHTARDRAVERYDLSVQAKAYWALYATLLGAPPVEVADSDRARMRQSP
jgi:glycosyltransferase involved in cell wall biosynthesis